jgi:hypothetical protein
MEKSAAKPQAPQSNQDGCSVDWGWLAGRKIRSATNDLKNFTITFEDGQTIRIQALTYQGEAFLAFTPYKDPGKPE